MNETEWSLGQRWRLMTWLKLSESRQREQGSGHWQMSGTNQFWRVERGKGVILGNSNREQGFSLWLRSKKPACQCRRLPCGPWIRKILWRRKWQSTSVFLPGKSHGQRSLGGYDPWGHITTEWLNNNTWFLKRNVLSFPRCIQCLKAIFP